MFRVRLSGRGCSCGGVGVAVRVSFIVVCSRCSVTRFNHVRIILKQKYLQKPGETHNVQLLLIFYLLFYMYIYIYIYMYIVRERERKIFMYMYIEQST